MSTSETGIDEGVLNDWHVVGPIEELKPGRVRATVLLGQPIVLLKTDAGEFLVWHNTAATPSGATAAGAPPDATRCNTLAHYGYLWVCLGTPARNLFLVPEAEEPGRRLIHAGSFGVKVAAPRAVENFLDMAHFPYVHTSYLGEVPHTEVRDYKVEVTADDEILATNCMFYQPRAALTAQDGLDVEYVYRVLRPDAVMLYKSSPARPDKKDIIALFIQPVGEEECVGHMWLCVFDDVNSDGEIRRFQQTIFGQDKPILENQVPKRLPIDPRAEMPGRADASSAAYRRWLREKKFNYGVIPARA